MEILVAILVIVGSICFLPIYFSSSARVRRKLHRAKVVPVANFPSHEVAKVTGVVESPGEVVQAPVSGRSCCAFALQVQEQRRNGHGQLDWQEIVNLSSGTDFWLRDDSGRALVRPDGGQIRLQSDFETDVATTPLREYLARTEVGVEWMDGRNLRFRETIVAVGQRLTVLGHGVWEPGDDPERKQLVVSGSGCTPMRLGEAEAPSRNSTNPHAIASHPVSLTCNPR